MVQNKNIVDIIIPTFNNIGQLRECVNSMLNTYTCWPFRIIIVNNGDKNTTLEVPDQFVDKIILVEPDGNLGWTGGIAEGLKHSDSELVMFCNDDIYIPPSSTKWLRSMVRILQNDCTLAAVGPSTNCVMGLQNLWAEIHAMQQYCSFLIGFCILLDRHKLDEVGGIDTSFVTGDDLDLSLRFRKVNYNLCVDKSTFVYHHGFQTGVKVHGDHTVKNGWNSPEMTKKTDISLIKKHGFLSWWNMMVAQIPPAEYPVDLRNAEKEVVLSYVNGCDPNKVLELGCGPELTVEGSIGLDKTPMGKENPNVPGKSVAHINYDLNDGPIPMDGGRLECIIARHILEHCINPVEVMCEIYRLLTYKGKCIVSLPDERIGDTINMNPEHLHTYTANSFVSLAEICGFEIKNISEGYNGVSFTVYMEKV